VDITELRLDDEHAHDGVIDELVTLLNSVIEVDAPWFNTWNAAALEGMLRYGFDLEAGRHFVGRDEGRVVAFGSVHTSEWDNRDLAWLEISVPPELRGRGLGSELLEHLESVGSGMGRTKFAGDAWDGSPGVPFAEGHGYPAKSREIHRRQHLDEVPLDKIEAMHAAARSAAAGYELMHLAGRAPDHLLPAVAQMASAINDAPLDDLDIEDEVFSAERTRNYEIATELRGQRLYRVIARHTETGELAGHTAVGIYADRPWLGYQHDTSVVRAHRGHRLGLLVKTAMNLWLADAEPELKTVDTWNAESNDRMIGVNEQLGYRWMGRVIAFQK
jgi:RimJ/RimL family protein N-acetyltransferase